jgi:murein DD-endopeptidase MepM/ murein hydrolase activator NlpD
MILKIKHLTTILIFLSGYYFLFVNYQNIVIEKNTDHDFSTESESNQDSNIIKDINLQKNKKQTIIKNDLNKVNVIEEINNLQEIVFEVKKNQTFSKIVSKYLSSDKVVFNVVNEIEKTFDLRKLKAGIKILFYQDQASKKLVKIIIPIENDINLNVFIAENIAVEKKYLKTKLESHSKEYLITNSLYSDGIKNNIPIEILTKLIRLYSFDLDFQRDIRKDTKVSISYDSKNIEDRDQQYFGDINYALIEIKKNKLEYFKFKTDEGFIDYFNKKGENVKKSILKTPIDGARLSSTFGIRKHPILGYNKMHRGVDFAASKGTSVFAGGNGTIEFAGKNGGYGNYIRIRHNNEYKTAYAHLLGFKKGISTGIRVNQGNVIGYVGSSGRSTGPHLHYEIIYQNEQINPLALKLPSGKKLKGKELERFISEMKTIYANHLNLLYE